MRCFNLNGGDGVGLLLEMVRCFFFFLERRVDVKDWFGDLRVEGFADGTLDRGTWGDGLAGLRFRISGLVDL
jgi:hypothetical protein